MLEQPPQIRQRLNVTQTAKGLHQIECTVEIVNGSSTDPKDVAVKIDFDLPQKTLELIKTMEKKLKDDGRKLVTDGE